MFSYLRLDLCCLFSILYTTPNGPLDSKPKSAGLDYQQVAAAGLLFGFLTKKSHLSASLLFPCCWQGDEEVCASTLLYHTLGLLHTLWGLREPVMYILICGLSMWLLVQMFDYLNTIILFLYFAQLIHRFLKYFLSRRSEMLG